MDDPNPSRKYDLKYASAPALCRPFPRKKFPHVQSKVKVYIDNIKREDRERRKVDLQYRSVPTELSTLKWKSFHDDDNNNVMPDTNIDINFLLKKKDEEVSELKNLLSSEREKSFQLRYKLDVLRFTLKQNHCMISDAAIQLLRSCPGPSVEELVSQQINDCDAENESLDDKFLSDTEENSFVSSETISLQTSDVPSVRKNVKNRFKKLLRCCAPCIKSKKI